MSKPVRSSLGQRTIRPHYSIEGTVDPIKTLTGLLRNVTARQNSTQPYRPQAPDQLLSGLPTMPPRRFKLPHLLPLGVATAHAAGGLAWPLIDPKGAILMYGLPERVADSPAAQLVFPSGSIRTSAFGVLV